MDIDGASTDSLGVWRNGGLSGQGNSTLAQGILASTGPQSGQDSSGFTQGFGRVQSGFTSRSTTAGNSGPLIGHVHSNSSLGAPPGNFIRIAGSFNTNWYPQTIP